MERDILQAALSVLHAYATNEPPDVIDVAVITAHHGNPDEISPDEMAKSLLERHLGKRDSRIEETAPNSTPVCPTTK